MADRPGPERPTTKLRRARASEAGELADLYLRARHAAVPEIPPLAHDDPDVRQWFVSTLSTECDMWVATDGGALLGFLALREGFVEQLYVDPRNTGRGIGTALLIHAQGLVPGLELWTFQANRGAQRFYERHGFEEVRRTAGDNEEGEPDILYRWERPDIGGQ